MNFVYILHSKQLDRYYIGQSQDLRDRLEKHNSGYYSNSYTSKAKDWELIFSLECESREQALKIETHIKRMKSRRYIENLIRYPEIRERLKLRYE